MKKNTVKKYFYQLICFKKLLTAVIFLLFSIDLTSQVCGTAATSIGLTCNTGVNITGLTINSVTPGNFDPYWTVSTNPWGGVPALVINPIPFPGGCLAPPGNQTFPYNSWITSSSWMCGGLPGNYSCTSVGDAYFSRKFFLPANQILNTNWIIFASDWVEDITVINSSVTVAYNNATITAKPYHRQNGMVWSWCNYKQGDWNEVIIHVKTVANLPNQCKFVGVRVETWGVGNTGWLSGPTIACSGSSNQYSISPTLAAGTPTNVPRTYAWTLPPSWSGSSSSAVMTAISGTNNGMMTATMHTMAPTGPMCLGIAAQCVSVHPNIIVSPTTFTLCQGKSMNLNATGATSYTWYAPGPVVISNISTAVITPTAAKTTYTCKGLTSAGCVYTKTVLITGLQAPALSVSAHTPQVCQGQCITLQVSGANSYTWSNGIKVFQNIVCPSTTTQYTVTGKLTNGCTNSAVAVAVIQPTPNIIMTANTNSVCPGNGVNLSATGANSYNWSTGQSPMSNINVVVNSTTSYTVIGTAANGCTSQATKLISVLGSPTVVVNPPFICPGMTNTITASGAATYTWYVNSPSTQTLVQQTILVNPLSPTIYSVCGTSSNFGCVGCTSITLGPAAPVQISVFDVTVCTTANLCQTVVATSTLNAPVNYTWFPSGGVNTNIGTICPTAPGIYTVSATSPSGCPSSSLFAVALATNCCGQPTTGLTRLTTPISGVVANGSYLIDGPVTLGNSTSFQNIEVWMTPEAKITVPSPWILTLDKAHLFSCGDYVWHGIDVQDGGQIITPSAVSQTLGSLIEDAEVAIKLDNISLVNVYPNAPINVEGVIFNKNFVGIQISNSDPTLDTLALGISGCVFASRDMTFTTLVPNLSWPNADASGNGLRVANNTTTGLVPPHSFPSLPQSNNLKVPHNGQPAHIGIKIENIGGNTTGNGIQIGLTYSATGLTSFNLFDGLGVGIDVTDASLTTMNNVFQNMQSYQYALSPTGFFGGTGISSIVTGLRNIRCKLKGTTMVDDGNRFWDCLTGIYAENVYELWVKLCLFRSTQTFGNVNLTFPLPGDKGIYIITNRFDFTVRECQFNNLKAGVVFETPQITQNFDIGGGPILGIFSKGTSVEQSYFGPLVTSNTGYTGSQSQGNFAEYLGDAIQISTPNTGGTWVNVGGTWLFANKIDRAFRGITINGMESHPLNVWGNSVYIEEDNNAQFGYGVSVTNHLDNLTIKSNTLHANTSWPQDNVSLVYCENNLGKAAPVIECNYLSDSHYGFHFEGQNPGTEWKNNEMCNHFAGLALVNKAEIGQQGDPLWSCGNVWSTNCQTWGSPMAQWEIYCDNSNPGLSPLYIFPAPGWDPSTIFSNSGAPYTLNNDLFYSAENSVCNWPSFISSVPSWRKAIVQVDSAQVKELQLPNQIMIFPNPTNGRLIISKPEAEKDLYVEIIDISGRVLFQSEQILLSVQELDLAFLAPAIYVLEVRNPAGVVLRQKLIKTD